VKKNFRFFIFLFILVVAAYLIVPGRTCATGSKRRPNIVLIYTDDQLPDTLGFQGGNVLTPHLDRIASQGLVFENHHCAATVCSPSRYSLLTGRFGGRCDHPQFLKQFPHGSFLRVENNVYMENDRRNLPALLSDSGYVTGMVGKWHLEPHYRDIADHGYKMFPIDGDPTDPKILAALKFNHDEVARRICKTGFDEARNVYWGNLKEVRLDALNYHNIDWSVQGAHEFMEENQDKPFFLYFSTTLHHGPHPKDSVYGKELVTGKGLLDEPLDVMPTRESIRRRLKDAQLPQETAYCTWLDDAIGSLLNKINELGLKKNTLFIFCSDHGAWRHGKTTCYDGGMQVPMVMYWPGTIDPGRSYEGLTQNIDITPTILELSGAKPPKDMQMDGKSLANIIAGSDEEVHDSLFCELGYSRAVKTKEWKYIAIRYPKDVQDKIDRGIKFNGWENSKLDVPYLVNNSHLGFHASSQNPNYFQLDQLYHLKEDPREEINVIDKYPEQAIIMKRLLQKYLESFQNRPFGEFVK
jgi:arylsulfatase A-like enzyme